MNHHRWGIKALVNKETITKSLRVLESTTQNANITSIYQLTWINHLRDLLSRTLVLITMCSIKGILQARSVAIVPLNHFALDYPAPISLFVD
jgi:hypothetical protein